MGKSRSTKVEGMAIPSPHTQLPSQSDQVVENSDRKMANTPSVSHKPLASSSQPMELDGRREATRAPTVAKARTNRRTAIPG